MPFYEIIYETGSNSVAQYDSDEEMLAAVGAHHQRAKTGGRGLEGAAGSHPAERIKEVKKYDKHPDDLNVAQTLSADVASKELQEIVKSATDAGVVSVPALVSAVRDLSSPLVDNPAPHESNFKMKESKTFTEGWDD